MRNNRDILFYLLRFLFQIFSVLLFVQFDFILFGLFSWFTFFYQPSATMCRFYDYLLIRALTPIRTLFSQFSSSLILYLGRAYKALFRYAHTSPSWKQRPTMSSMGLLSLIGNYHVIALSKARPRNGQTFLEMKRTWRTVSTFWLCS